MQRRLPWSEWSIIAAASALFVAAASLEWLAWDEVFGFLTGGICVWLVVRRHIWNWPIGLLNNGVFFVLFWDKRLYADMGLQVVFFALGLYGWWNWMKRGPDSAPLKPMRAGARELLAVVAFVIGATIGLRELLLWLNGAAPIWDALTTALSLGAQYLLGRKRIEHWYFWIVADIVYVPLYFGRDLPLIGVLYAGFLILCVFGLIAWRRALKPEAP